MRSTMSWMSASCSIQRFHDSDGCRTTPVLLEVEEEDAAGMAAMATTARLERGEEIARKMKAESSGNSLS